MSESNNVTFTFGTKQAMVLSFVVGIVIGGLAIASFTGSSAVVVAESGSGTVPQGANNPPTQPPPQPSVPSVNADALIDDDPVLGDPNAPVTIVEFSDFQCPFCGRFRSQTFDQIKAEYIDTGKVKFVYRDFPLSSIHPSAQKAAEAGQCADDQGKFWEYHDKIFEGQSILSVESLKQWAVDLGLDSSQFNDCLDSNKYQQEVLDDLNAAQAAGGRGTPFFVIGSQTVSGAQPFTNFQTVIEAELTQ